MGDLFGAIGSVASAALQADAIKSAAQTQANALKQQREFVFNNLNPDVVNAQATAADIQNANARLALQGQVDPALLQARYQSENQVLNQGSQIGQQSGQVMDAATQNALNATPGLADAKNKLVSSAMDQLKAGATLPPDVEAQLVQAGLEQSGMVTNSASGRGMGGQMLRTVLGTAGIQLQQQRQQQASQLLTSAQNLDTARQGVLTNLFPSLAATQLNNLAGSQGVLNQSNSLMPQAGLSGNSIANIWLARVGATNQLAQSAANVQAQSTMGQAQAWGGAMGGLGSAVGNMIPSSGWTSAGAGTNFGVGTTAYNAAVGAPTSPGDYGGGMGTGIM